MSLLRIVNAFYAALFLVMALVSLAFLTASMSDQVRQPENIWISIGWAALFALYAVLVFVNMRRAGTEGAGGRLIALNVAAAVPLLAGTFAGDPAGRFLCGVAVLPFAFTTAMLLIKRSGNPA
jgi:choline-glycine betaine transporter